MVQSLLVSLQPHFASNEKLDEKHPCAMLLLSLFKQTLQPELQENVRDLNQMLQANSPVKFRLTSQPNPKTGIDVYIVELIRDASSTFEEIEGTDFPAEEKEETDFFLGRTSADVAASRGEASTLLDERKVTERFDVKDAANDKRFKNLMGYNQRSLSFALYAIAGQQSYHLYREGLKSDCQLKQLRVAVKTGDATQVKEILSKIINLTPIEKRKGEIYTLLFGEKYTADLHVLKKEAEILLDLLSKEDVVISQKFRT
ncbi:MAG: hypothetical protein ACPGUD_13245 [Parashewanella sp.]